MLLCGPCPGSGVPNVSFFIEAEDFNYGGGQTKPEASVMPYIGGAYSGLAAVDNIDYHRGNQADSPLYRIGEIPQVPMDMTDDVNRGVVANIQVNYKMGWIGNDMWYNYTRTFPAGNYNVYAGLSHGDAPTSGTRMTGSLQKVTSDATKTNQTVANLGTFDAPATGGWGNNALVPLNSGGSPASLNLSGATTLRMLPTNGDFDFLLFTSATALVKFNPPTFAGTTVTITWVGTGTLQQATVLTGRPSDWSDVIPAPTGNTYQATAATTGNKYFRIRP